MRNKKNIGELKTFQLVMSILALVLTLYRFLRLFMKWAKQYD